MSCILKLCQRKCFCKHGHHTASLQLLSIKLGSAEPGGPTWGSQSFVCVQSVELVWVLGYEKINLWESMPNLLESFGQYREQLEGIDGK